VPHALPISFVSILPPAQYWVRSTDHSAPRYAAFSILLIHALNNYKIIRLMVFDEYVSSTKTGAYYTSFGFSLTDNLVIKTLNDLIQALKKLKEEVASQVSQSVVILLQGLFPFCQ
jgi:hypothetical protein